MRKIISAVVGIGTTIWIWSSEVIGFSVAGKLTATVLLIGAMGLDIFDPYDIKKRHKNLFNWGFVVSLAAGMILLRIVRQ